MSEGQRQEQVATSGGNGLAVRSVRRKKRFLLALAGCGIVDKACKLSNVPLSTVYSSWRKDDAEFVEAMTQAHDVGEGVLRSRCIGEVENRAFNGNDGMLYFITKYVEPRFKDSSTVNVGVVGPASVSIEIDGGQHAIPEQSDENKR